MKARAPGRPGRLRHGGAGHGEPLHLLQAAFHLPQPLHHRHGFGRKRARLPVAGLSELHAHAEGQAIAKSGGQAPPDRRIRTVCHIT